MDMDTVTLDISDVDQLFAQATHQADYILGMYCLVYSDWDNVEKVDGWPKCGSFLHKLLFMKAISFDRDRHPDVVAGGGWMNNGFGEDASLNDMQVRLAPVRLKEE